MLREEAAAKKAELSSEIAYYETLKREVNEEISRIDNEFSELEARTVELDAEKAKIDEYREQLNEEKDTNVKYVASYDHEIAERQQQITRLDQSVNA